MDLVALIWRRVSSGTMLSAGTGAVPSLGFEVDDTRNLAFCLRFYLAKNSWKLLCYNQLRTYM